MIDSQSVTLGVPVLEKSSLQHFVRGKSDTGNDIGRIKCSLLHILEIVFRISVQFKFSNWNQRKIFLRPDFCQVKRVETIVLCLLFGHNLNVELPLWKVASFNGIEQVSLRRLPVYSDHLCSFFIRQVFNSLLGSKMKFHPVTHIVTVYEAVGVAAKTVHMAIPLRNTPITHDDRHLMQGFGK